MAGPQMGDPAALMTTLESLAELLPDIVHNILNLYSRAWTFTDEKIPPISYSHSTIRFTKLLVAIRREHGQLNKAILDHIVLNEPHREIDVTETKPFMSTSELSSLLLRAYPISTDASMPLSERTYILAAIASVLSDLGHHRKKAVVMKELMFALLPALVQARKDGAAEMGVHPAASLASLNVASSNGLSAERSTPSIDDSEQAMRHFLTLVCRSFGIVSLNESHRVDKSGGKQAIESSVQRTTASQLRAIQQASMQYVGPLDLKIDILRACISICEALPNLSGALQYSADLLKNSRQWHCTWTRE